VGFIGKQMVIWITGLPGAGKTTIAKLLFEALRNKNVQTVLLDGDSLRQALGDYNYDTHSRNQLALTYARLANMFSQQKTIAICATVSMFDSVRDWNRENIESYFEVYVKVSPDILKLRNQKELHSKAVLGQEINVHGFDLAIEEPKNSHLIINNDGNILPQEHVLTILRELTL